MKDTTLQEFLRQFEDAAARSTINSDYMPDDTEYVLLPGGQWVRPNVAARVERCGTLMRGVDPATGEPSYYRYKCGMPSLCIRCQHERMKEEKARVSRATEDGHVYMSVVSEGEARSLVRKLRDTAGATSYRRYPMNDGMVAILHLAEGVGGERTSVDDVDWNALTQTPQGKNISGKLQETLSKPEPQEDAVVVQTEYLAPEKPNGMAWVDFEDRVADAWELAVLKTAHLAPDLETLQMCMRERMNAFRLQLHEVGIHVTFCVYRYAKLYRSQVDWVPYNEKIRRKRRTDGMVFEKMDQMAAFMAQFERSR